MRSAIACALFVCFFCIGCAEKDKGEQRADNFIEAMKSDALFNRVGRLENNIARDYATMMKPGDVSWMDADELRLVIRWKSTSQNENGATANIDVGNLLSMDARDCMVDVVWGSTDKDGRFTKTKTAMVKIAKLKAGEYVGMNVNLAGFTPDEIGRLTLRHVICSGRLGPDG